MMIRDLLRKGSGRAYLDGQPSLYLTELILVCTSSRSNVFASCTNFCPTQTPLVNPHSRSFPNAELTMHPRLGRINRSCKGIDAHAPFTKVAEW